MATKKTNTKAGKPAQERQSYFVAFFHGKPTERDVENMEINFNDLPKIESHSHVQAMEQHLSKSFVNPKVINFIYLRTIK